MAFFYQTSGFSPNPTLISAVAQILNGTWINKPILDSKCTVLVVGPKVPKTEKLLMALGAAIPILDRKYLYDCVNAKKVLLDQDSYDIGDKETAQKGGGAGRKLVPQTLAQRRLYRQGSRLGQCQGWHILLALEDVQKRETYQRILKSAGAVVFKEGRDEAFKVTPQLTHVFSEPEFFWNSGPWQKFLRDARSEKGRDSKTPLFVGSYFYISEFLFSDYVPDIRQYTIDSPKMKVIHAKYAWQCFKDQEAEAGKKNKRVDPEEKDAYPVERNMSLSMAPNVSFSSVPSKRKKTHLADCQVSLVNIPAKRLKLSISTGAQQLSSPLKPITRRTSSRSSASSTPMKCPPTPQDESFNDLYFTPGSPLVLAPSGPGSQPTSNPAWKEFYDAVNVLGAIRYVSVYGADVASAKNFDLCLSKVPPDEFHVYEKQLKISAVSLIHGNREKDTPEDSPKRWIMSLQVLENSLDSSTLPPPEIIQLLLMKGLWNQEHALVRDGVFSLLTRWSHFTYPPLEEEICDIYLRAISRVKVVNQESSFDPLEPLNFLFDLLDSGKGNGGPEMILEWLVQILHMNFEHIFRTGLLRNSLLAHVIWPSSDLIVIDRNVKRILEKMFQALAADNGTRFGVFKCVLKMVSMIGQIFARDDLVQKSRAKQCEFAREIVNLGMKFDAGLFKRVVPLIQPRWLSARISYLLVTNGASDSLMSLRQIVHSLTDNPEPANARNGGRGVETRQQEVPGSSSKALRPRDVNVPVVTQYSNPNKKNQFGETLVHIACKKGHLDRLSNLLDYKAVNINARDNNGWTPLHEAVCHGRLHCVQKLLQFEACPVDLLAQAGDHRMNAFHEAVDNNLLDIVTEIIKASQHDGRYPTFGELMAVKSGEGKSPMDYAITDEMKTLLLTQESASIHLNFDNENLAGRLLTANLISKYISLFSLQYVKQELKSANPGGNKASQTDEERVGAVKRFSGGGGGWGHSAKYVVWRCEKTRAMDIRTFNSIKDSADKSQIVLSFCKR